MPIDLGTLHPELKTALDLVLDRCKARGYVLRPYQGLRTPFDQAKLWRQSRAIEEITVRIGQFDDQGATFLAHCLRAVGPQHGEHVTDAPPGYSWHQWGEAVDCFWLVDGKAEWSTTRKIKGANGYRVYADEATAAGLTAGGLWPRFKDWPHVQWRKANNPAQNMSPREISEEMEARFGEA